MSFFKIKEERMTLAKLMVTAETTIKDSRNRFHVKQLGLVTL